MTARKCSVNDHSSNQIRKMDTNPFDHGSSYCETDTVTETDTVCHLVIVFDDFDIIHG